MPLEPAVPLRGVPVDGPCRREGANVGRPLVPGDRAGPSGRLVQRYRRVRAPDRARHGAGPGPRRTAVDRGPGAPLESDRTTPGPRAAADPERALARGGRCPPIAARAHPAPELRRLPAEGPPASERPARGAPSVP